jgi:hypothetical protein
MDVINQVYLSCQAVDAWGSTCQRAILALLDAGLLHGDPPPDETAEVDDDGWLRIRGQIGECEISLRVPPEHWAWMPGVVC